MRRRILKSNAAGGGVIEDPSLAPPLSVVFADKSDGNKLIIVDGEKALNKYYPANNYEPIGIVVIPGEHGVLKDGTGTINQCGIMSIKAMSYSSPVTGAISEGTMYWGGYGTDISGKSDELDRYDSVSNGLLNYQHVVTTADNTSNTANGYSSSSYAYIPRQGSAGSTPSRSSSPYAPSPYIGSDYKSGGYNESYGLKNGVVESEANNALSDFKGIVNTKIITDLATGENWKEGDNISNKSDANFYPAACCCARFKTTGTKSFIECSSEELKNGTGFWYLPACGELGYIIPRLGDINDTINKLNKEYGSTYGGSVGVQLSSSNYFWSSSEYSSNGAYTVYTGNGSANLNLKYDSYRVRAFLRL